MMTWTYVEYKNGQLFTDEGDLFIVKLFYSESEAEQYLVDNDIRASIR